MSVKDFWQECKERLEEAGLTPMVDPEQWAFFRDSALYHRFCFEEGAGVPVATMQVKNRATGEGRPFPYDQLIDRAHELMQQDPNWTIEQCYGCCP